VEVVDRNTLRVVLPEDGKSGICVLKSDTILAPLPKDVRVVTTDDKIIRPSGIFLVSIETFGSFHLLTDVNESRWAMARF
jgi:hypothetical protein